MNMMNDTSSCLICEKHKGISHHPPGGYIYTGEFFAVCHAPVNAGPLGTLLIESRRHVLDYASMTPQELAALGPLLQCVYSALRELTVAERIYQVAMVDGVPHFHCWLVPRRPNDTAKGLKFLAMDLSCDTADAEQLVQRLRALRFE
jgi:diadenosine tetraphosphate (Ap4A) HIT family hydrolase